MRGSGLLIEFLPLTSYVAVGRSLIPPCAPVSNTVKAMLDSANLGEFFEQHKLTYIKMFRKVLYVFRILLFVTLGKLIFIIIIHAGNDRYRLCAIAPHSLSMTDSAHQS